MADGGWHSFIVNNDGEGNFSVRNTSPDAAGAISVPLPFTQWFYDELHDDGSIPLNLEPSFDGLYVTLADFQHSPRFLLHPLLFDLKE